MLKIKKRTKSEQDPVKAIGRKNDIMMKLNDCFEKNSIDAKDQFDILKWACLGIPSEKLFYYFEKIKRERLKNE